MLLLALIQWLIKIIKMFKRLLFFIILCILSDIKIQAQNKFKPSFAIGITKRMISIRLNDLAYTSNKYEFFYYSIGLPQTYLSVDIKHAVFKNKFILELSNYFTHSEFRHVRPNLLSQVYTTEYRFKHDHSLGLIYPFKSRKKRPQFMLGLGLGYMNLGTNFTYDILTGFDSSRNPILIKDNKGTFSFFAPKLIFGVQKNRINGFFIVNSTRDDQYEKNPTIWLEFKATYTFKPFEKKVK